MYDEVITKLNSLEFMDNANRSRLKLLLSATDCVLNSFSRMYRKAPQEALGVLNTMLKIYTYLREAVAAANATIAFASGESLAGEYWSSRILQKPDQIPMPEWINSVWTILDKLRWPTATSPNAYIAQAARFEHARSYLHGGEPRKRDALHDSRNLVSLEHLAQTPGEAVAERRFTMISLAELVAAAERSPELREFIALKFRNPQWKKPALWRELGWTDQYGKQIDREFRRLRSQLRRQGAGMEWRSVPQLGISDASCTYYFESFYDGNRGRQTGTYQHKGPGG